MFCIESWINEKVSQFMKKYRTVFNLFGKCEYQYSKDDHLCFVQMEPISLLPRVNCKSAI